MLRRVQDWLTPDADLDLAGDPGRLIHGGMWLIALLIGGGFLWMALAPLAGAVIANGTVRTEQTRLPIQHAGGGTVAGVLVRDGDVVKAGQPLLTMHDPRTQATYDTYLIGIFAEQAKQARLRAEQVLAAELRYPAELEAERGKPRRADILDQEKRVFQTRRSALTHQIAIFEAQQASVKQETGVLRRRVESQREAGRLLGDEAEANRKLADAGFVARTRVTGLERSAAEYRASVGELESDMLRADQRVLDYAWRIEEMKGGYVQAATAELKESQLRLEELQQSLRPIEDAQRKMTVVAPADGRVMNLRVQSAGMVVGAGAPLMELVPAHSPLQLDSGVAPKDIRHIRIGQPVEVSLTAYNHRTTPRVMGKVVYVAPDAVGSEAVPSYYPVKVELDAASLREAGIEGLLPGMQAVLYFRTEDRTLLDYLLEPIVDSLRSAFREP